MTSLQPSHPSGASLVQRLFAALDEERGDAYRRFFLTVMLATRPASARTQRKGCCVTVLYLHALGEARTPSGRERRWRRFVTLVASLSADLPLARTMSERSTRQAQVELEQIVAENADLVAGTS